MSSSILDIPDEILKKIILRLNARERVPLGNSCRRLNKLVFEDSELLRSLDFSKKGYLTSMTDIQQYFKNENACKQILKLNMRNVVCVEPGRDWQNSLSKATNLVNVDIQGTKWTDIWQFGAFLNPLVHLQRLSTNWPEMKESNTPLCCKILEKPFGRLLYLSVKTEIRYLTLFIPSLHLCHQLKELHVAAVESSDQSTYNDIWGGEIKELRNLELVEYCGPCAIPIKERFASLLSDPEKWTDFQLNMFYHPINGFHLEKNVEVCEELLASKWTERISNPAWNSFNLGWVLFPERLLEEVLRITYENMPEKFCSLSTFMKAKRCLLKIEDAKRLLKNPRCQISYLYVNHEIEIGCDLHLIASAFSSLTELVLVSAITRNFELPLVDKDFEKRRRKQAKRGLHEDQYESLNLDSSFKMLIENTPNLRHFTLYGSSGSKTWDWDELHFISGWRLLKTLRLLCIPIKDGHFLIEIGKQCKNLQTLQLRRLGSSDACCYKKELMQMLVHCRNLRVFSIEAEKMGKISELFTSLANNAQLRKVRAKNIGHTNTTAELISSINLLLHQCSVLTTFSCEIDDPAPVEHNKLLSAVKRWESELNRPNFQIQMVLRKQLGSSEKIGTIRQNMPRPHPFPYMWTEK